MQLLCDDPEIAGVDGASVFARFGDEDPKSMSSSPVRLLERSPRGMRFEPVPAAKETAGVPRTRGGPFMFRRI